VAKTGLRNIPRKENLALGGLVNPWGHPTPAVYDPECFYWENPS
jgi:peptide/nickel transport system substrate-binding protein